MSNTGLDASTPGGEFRLRALEGMERLNAALLGSDSATLTLETWCGAPVTARRMPGDSPADPALRQRLEAEGDEPVAYRHVQLVCGGRVLSEAQNWYLPGRLTPDMLDQLAMTETAFGRVILPLGPVRETTSVTVLWRPAAQIRSLPPAAPLFEHRARVFDRRGHPLAEVVETYSSDALAFGFAR